MVNEHILEQAWAQGHRYYSDFEIALGTLQQRITKKEFQRLRQKLQLDAPQFKEKQFIQHAVETSITSSLAQRFPGSFRYEVQVNPNRKTDVDCQITHRGLHFNVEVKCSDFISKEVVDSRAGIKVSTLGRIPEHERRISHIGTLIGQTGTESEPAPAVEPAKNMDNNMKQFLVEAQSKFSDAKTSVNLLFVGCDDAHDVQHWYYYLCATQGLFRSSSFHPVQEYDLVDGVILTNLYFRHNRPLSKQLSNSWNIDDAFMMLVPNAMARTKKPEVLLVKEFLVEHGLEIDTFDVPGNVPQDVKDSQRISYFISTELEQKSGKFYFERPA